MVWRGKGHQGHEEKKKIHQRNTGGTGRDEEMWTTRAKERWRENERRKIEMEWESEVSIKKMNPSAFGR